MKKTLIYLSLLILGNFLCAKFAFAQDDTRFIALFGFLIGMFSLYQFPAKLAGFLSKREFSLSELQSENAKNDKSLHKPLIIWLTGLVMLIALHVWGYINFFRFQNELLEKNGVYAKAITFDKKWESRSKNESARLYIYYSYKFGNKFYEHSYSNDTIEIGDTLIIKILPDNPDNHKVVRKQKQK